jgi:hypothetical protein
LSNTSNPFCFGYLKTGGVSQNIFPGWIYILLISASQVAWISGVSLACCRSL